MQEYYENLVEEYLNDDGTSVKSAGGITHLNKLLETDSDSEWAYGFPELLLDLGSEEPEVGRIVIENGEYPLILGNIGSSTYSRDAVIEEYNLGSTSTNEARVGQALSTLNEITSNDVLTSINLGKGKYKVKAHRNQLQTILRDVEEAKMKFMEDDMIEYQGDL